MVCEEKIMCLRVTSSKANFDNGFSQQLRRGNIQQRISELLDKIDKDMNSVKLFFQSPVRTKAYDDFLVLKEDLHFAKRLINLVTNFKDKSNGSILEKEIHSICIALNEFQKHRLFHNLDPTGRSMVQELCDYFFILKSENHLACGVINDLNKIVEFLNAKTTEIENHLGKSMTILKQLGNDYLSAFDHKSINVGHNFKIQSVVGASEICKGQDGVAVCGKVAVLVDVVTADNNWHFSKEDRAKFHVECAVYAKARPQIMANELHAFFERTPGAKPDEIKAKILEIDECISKEFKTKFKDRLRKDHEPLKYPTSTIKIAIVEPNKQSVHLFLQGDGNEFVVTQNEDQTYIWTALRDKNCQCIQLKNGQAYPCQSGPTSPLSSDQKRNLGFLEYIGVESVKYVVIGSDGIDAKELMRKNPDQIIEIPHQGRHDDASTVLIGFTNNRKRKSETLNEMDPLKLPMEMSPNLPPLTIQELRQKAFEWFEYIQLNLNKDKSITKVKLDKIKMHFFLFIEGPRAVQNIMLSDKYLRIRENIKSMNQLSTESIGHMCSNIIKIIIDIYSLEVTDIESSLKKSNVNRQVVHDFIHFIQALDKFLTFIDGTFYKKDGDDKKPRILQETASISSLRNLINFSQMVRKNEFVTGNITQKQSVTCKIIEKFSIICDQPNLLSSIRSQLNSLKLNIGVLLQSDQKKNHEPIND